jgi:hypothetical protein
LRETKTTRERRKELNKNTKEKIKNNICQIA